MTSDELSIWRAERNAALTAGDLSYFIKHGVPEDLAEAVLHKTRYECVAIDAALRHTSGA